MVSPTVTTTYYVRAQGTCNTTICVSALVFLNTNSVAAGSVSIIPDSICIGSATAITASGGTLGSGAHWNWYTGSCGGTFMGTGMTIIDVPSTNMTYFVRAEGVCNTTGCITKTVIVNINSVMGIAANSSPAVVCPGSSSTLSVNVLQFGAGGNIYWYSGTCGGNFLGSGNNFVDSPISTTTYYARAEGLCNTTNCLSTTIIINTNSSSADSILASKHNICTGDSVILGISGGQTGFGASWKWYSISCGGTNAGINTSITIYPTVSSDYFVRAENTCNTTGCVSIHIIVNDSSVSAISITTSLLSLCTGDSSIMAISGGSLGTTSSWFWYTGSCGGNYAENGSSFKVTPSITTDYYVRAEGLCNTTNCVHQQITVNYFSVAADLAIATKSSICLFDSSIISCFQ